MFNRWVNLEYRKGATMTYNAMISKLVNRFAGDLIDGDETPAQKKEIAAKIAAFEDSLEALSFQLLNIVYRAVF